MFFFLLDMYFLASTVAAAEESTQLCLKVCQNHFSNLSNFIHGSLACKSHTAQTVKGLQVCINSRLEPEWLYGRE